MPHSTVYADVAAIVYDNDVKMPIIIEYDKLDDFQLFDR